MLPHHPIPPKSALLACTLSPNYHQSGISNNASHQRRHKPHGNDGADRCIPGSKQSLIKIQIPPKGTALPHFTKPPTNIKY